MGSAKRSLRKTLIKEREMNIYTKSNEEGLNDNYSPV